MPRAKIGATPLVAFLMVMMLAAGSACAAGSDDLYQARAFVTGQGAAERARGFALCLAEVLVKVSGDPGLLDDPRLKPLEAEAGRMVADFRYHDRMSGIPVHDEQGTRERPFDLFVTFDQAAVDAALRSLDRRPWTGPRPRVVVLLGVKDAQTSYVLASDGARGLGQRQSLAAAGQGYGLPLIVPSTDALTVAGITYERLTQGASPALGDVAKAMGGDALLTGTLDWTEAALGWTVKWYLPWHGQDHHWEIAGVSFDDAFRDAADHTARIMFSAAPAHQ